jgi:hypothetical protein
MKKAILKRILNIFEIFALTILLFSCPDEFHVQKHENKAIVSFSVTSVARTVIPQVSLADVTSYELLGGINGAAETKLAEFTTGEITVALEPGTWNFTLNAYNDAGEHILQGTIANKQINLTGTNQVAFSLSVMNDGTGAIEITLNFSESAGITRIVVKSNTHSEDFTPTNSGSFIYSKTGIAAGDYFSTFELYRGNGLRAVVSELVLVRNNLSSDKTITLVGDDLKPLLSGTVGITGTIRVGEILTANTDSLGGSGTLSYQWNRVGTGASTTAIPGAHDSAYIIQAADADYTITVTVTREGYSGSVTSNPTATVIFPPLTGTVSITGIVEVGETLTANTDSLDGIGTISYQWNRVGTGGSVIPDAHNSTYTVQTADAGYRITVTVTRTGYSGSVTSSATDLIAIFNSVTADGSASQFTTALTLTFSQAIPGLYANDITLSGVPGVQKGTLSGPSGSGPVTYTLPISGFSAGGTLDVSVAKSGYAISDSQKTVTIYVISVTLNNVTADGSPLQFTTALTLTFSRAIPGLSAGDITLSHSVSGQSVSKGTLSDPNGSGTVTYTLPISGFSSSGFLTVAVAKSGYAINDSQKTVPIYAISVTFNNVTADGSDSQTTTTLTLSFDQAIPGLSAGDITLSHSVSGQSVSKGTLGGSGPVYTLPISGVIARGTLTVSVVKSGYAISGSQTVTIYSPLSGMVSITGTAWARQTLTANTANLGGSGTISYQWKRVGTDDSTTDVGTNSSTYTVQSADVGSTITVTVTRANNSGSVSSDPTDTVTLPPLTVTASISGTAEVGQTLTANLTSYPVGTLRFQWKRVETGGSTTDVGTNSSTYVVQSADVGCTIIVTVTISGYAGSVDSDPTATVPPVLPGTVSISGTAEVGQTLTANTTNLGGSGTISYQWKRISGGTTANIGTNSSTYMVQSADAGSTITVTVTRPGYSGVTSSPTATVTLPPLTGTVTITGTTVAGQTLTANTTNLGGSGTISYQWKRIVGGTTPQDIGTNSNTYTLQQNDVGDTITVTVTRSGYSGSVTSSPTATVTRPPLTGTVTISGNPWLESTLSVNTTNLGGSGTISYGWFRERDGVRTNIGNNETYRVTSADDFNTITVTVTRSGYSGSITSPAMPIGSRGTKSAPYMLTESVWENNSVQVNYEVWYFFLVTSGTTYRVWWNDSYQGNGSKTGNVSVSAQYSSGTSIFTGVANGWTTAQSFTASRTDYVYLRVYPNSTTGDGAGSYGIVYNTSTTRPPL